MARQAGFQVVQYHSALVTTSTVQTSFKFVHTIQFTVMISLIWIILFSGSGSHRDGYPSLFFTVTENNLKGTEEPFIVIGQLEEYWQCQRFVAKF